MNQVCFRLSLGNLLVTIVFGTMTIGWTEPSVAQIRAADRGRHEYPGGAGGTAGITGVAAGAITGGALKEQAYPGYGYGDARPVATYPVGGPAAYCRSGFRSFSPAIGTYLGLDGMKHPCP